MVGTEFYNFFTKKSTPHSLKRTPDAPIEDDGTGRSLSVRLMSTAFMDFANGKDDYNNEKDCAWKRTFLD